MRLHSRLPDHAAPGAARPHAAPPRQPDADLAAEREALERTENLFHGALAREPRHRASWLRAQCADRPELVRDVLALLAADAAAVRPDGPLSQPVGFLADLVPDADTGTDRTAGTRDPDILTSGARRARPAPVRLAPGDAVGVYRIVRLLGQGGMGTVYLAEREDVGATVALKVVRATLAHSARARARFLAERRAMARFSHPNIARLLDAGIIADGPLQGAPWVAMEYVDGLPLDEACDRRRLGVRERLAVFAEVCGAVEAVHRRRVVHRDLKPSNVLVTDDGRPMLLDFGVAAVLDPATGAAGGTLEAAAPGPLTPQYAAPEQVRDEPPSTAGDVYALGLMLYELLTGRRAYEVRGRTRREAVQTVLAARFVPPSAVVTADPEAAVRAAVRATRPRALRRALRGDLDAVVRRALAPDPGDRYATADALRADVLRVLAREAVEARAAGSGARLAFRMLRAVQRHRLALGVALVAAGLAGAAAGAYARQQEAARQTQRAVASAARLRSAVRDLVDAHAFRGGRPDSLAVRMLAHGERAAAALAGRPEAEAELLTTIASAWDQVGDSAAARRVAGRAATIRWHLDHGDPSAVDEGERVPRTVTAARLAVADSAAVEAAALRRRVHR